MKLRNTIGCITVVKSSSVICSLLSFIEGRFKSFGINEFSILEHLSIEKLSPAALVYEL